MHKDKNIVFEASSDRPRGESVRILLTLAGPALMQAIIAYLVVRSSGGSQSWAGELALGLALLGVPATLVANYRLLTMEPKRPEMEGLGLCLLVAAILPVILAAIHLVHMFLVLRA